MMDVTQDQLEHVFLAVTEEKQSSTEIQERCCLDKNIVRAALMILVSRKRVFMTGKFRWTRYQLPGCNIAEETSEALGDPLVRQLRKAGLPLPEAEQVAVDRLPEPALQISEDSDHGNESSQILSDSDLEMVFSVLSSEKQSSTEIRDRCGLDVSIVRAALKSLVGVGRVLMTGRVRWTRYQIMGSGMEADSVVSESEDTSTSIPAPCIEMSAESRANQAVYRWLQSSNANSWIPVNDVARDLSRDDIPLMKILTAIREGIVAGKIRREWHQGPCGLYRQICRATPGNAELADGNRP